MMPLLPTSNGNGHLSLAEFEEEERTMLEMSRAEKVAAGNGHHASQSPSPNGHAGETHPKGAMTWREFQKRKAGRPKRWVVEGLLPRPSLILMMGDSAIGKTAYDNQLSLCVSSGKEFLGRRVEAGPVLVCDLESGSDTFEQIVTAQCRHLGLTEPPQNFRFVLTKDEVDLVGLEREIVRIKPLLVVIDSLRAYYPSAEKSAENAGNLLNSLKSMGRRHDCSIFLVHHPKKENEDRDGNSTRRPLSESRVIDYMNYASGTRALVNLTDVRIAAELVSNSDSADLLVKWNIRSQDDSANTYLRRVCDDQGEPLGYSVASGLALLNPSYRDVLPKLPDTFSYKVARMTWGKGDSSTVLLLKNLVAAGAVRHDKATGEYRKTQAAIPGGKS